MIKLKILDFISIPRMFSAYARNVNQWKQQDSIYRSSQYYCLNCDFIFGASWQYQGNIQGFGDRNVFCPQCGRKHAATGSVRYLDENETAPINMNLSIVEGKDFVSLKVFTNAIRFTELLHILRTKVDEEFRFNIKTRKTVYRRKVDRRLTDEFEIGNPFDRHIFDVSILYFLTHDSTANLVRKDLSRLLKTLRETLQNKLEARCKHRIKSMFVNCGSTYGRLLFPLYNMAFRMVFLDAPNLPAPYKAGDREINYFWRSRNIDDNDNAFNDLNYFIKKKSYILALIELHHLPNVRSVRKLLQQDFFAYGMLKTAKTLTDNIDYLIASYQVLVRLGEYAHNTYSEGDFIDICRFCAEIAPVYGIGSVLQLLNQDLKNGRFWYIRDIASMYHQLSTANRNLVPNIKFSALHDWLAAKVKEQRINGFDFNVPEPIRRRLMMQKDSIRFFLPEKSTELSAAGKDLHNCVGSYVGRMAANQLQIVLVADDTGKLIACMEIKNGSLVQAKLKYNKPVALNAKINAEVTQWAEKTGIEIRTPDVRRIYLPAVVAAV